MALDREIEQITPVQWQAYLQWSVIRPSKQSAWDLIQNEFAEILNQSFIEVYGTQEGRLRALAVAGRVQAAFRKKLLSCPWLSQTSRGRAASKLESIQVMVASPPGGFVQCGFSIDPTRSSLENLWRWRQLRTQAEFARLSGSVAPAEFQGPTYVLGAHYDPTLHTVYVPAANLMEPWFRSHDLAWLYGNLGTALAHEMSHEFDPSNIGQDWMLPAERQIYQEICLKIQREFEQYSWKGTRVNGARVCGEMFADLSGLEVAHEAFLNECQEQGIDPERPGPEGLTPHQRFFVGFAQSWGGQLHPELATWCLENTPYPLPEMRVNGILAQSLDFARVFGLPPGCGMTRPEGTRIDVWRTRSI